MSKIFLTHFRKEMLVTLCETKSLYVIDTQANYCNTLSFPTIYVIDSLVSYCNTLSFPICNRQPG